MKFKSIRLIALATSWWIAPILALVVMYLVSNGVCEAMTCRVTLDQAKHVDPRYAVFVKDKVHGDVSAVLWTEALRQADLCVRFECRIGLDGQTKDGGWQYKVIPSTGGGERVRAHQSDGPIVDENYEFDGSKFHLLDIKTLDNSYGFFGCVIFIFTLAALRIFRWQALVRIGKMEGQ